jgi:hypothetical protein
MNTSTASTGLRGLIATTIFGALAPSFSAVSAAAKLAGLTLKDVKLAMTNR